LPLSPCFWLALSLLSWGYLVFSNVVDLLLSCYHCEAALIQSVL